MASENKAVLHIANDYSGSSVYMNLISSLDRLGLKQIVYTPLRGRQGIGKNSILMRTIGSRIIYSSILNWHLDRFFYPYKIFKILKDIQLKVDFSKVQYIHAHTWYSDGGVAYLLSKKYNIPYVVTVRNTDLNLFQKKIIYLRSFGKTILHSAEHIVLISASYKKRLFHQSSLKKVINNIKRKTVVLPNGVDPFWIANSIFNEKTLKNIKPIELIYVGRFSKGKNLPLLQKSVIELNKEASEIAARLHIVGGSGTDKDLILKNVAQYPEYFIYHGKILNKEKLASLYQSSDVFVMPSSCETFGLVYVEAMLQGLPILYTENEGIDGFYSDDIGEKVKEPTFDEVFDKLTTMIENLNSYKVPTAELKINHDWTKIAKNYLSIYKKNL